MSTSDVEMQNSDDGEITSQTPLNLESEVAEEENVTFTIFGDNATISVDRITLSESSPYFASMLQDHAPGTTIPLSIPPLSDSKSVKRLLTLNFNQELRTKESHWTKTFGVTSNNIVSLYAAAHYYRMETAVGACIQFMKKYSVVTARCLRLLEIHLKYPRPEMARVLGDLIGPILAVIWDYNEFDEMSLPALLFILQLPFLMVTSEIQIFLNGCDWFKKHPMLDVHCITTVLDEFHWYAMSADERLQCQSKLGELFPDHQATVTEYFTLVDTSTYPHTRQRNRHQSLYICVQRSPSSHRSAKAAIYEFDLRLNVARGESWPYDVNPSVPVGHCVSPELAIVDGVPHAIIKRGKKVSLWKLERRSRSGALFFVTEALTADECCLAEPSHYANSRFPGVVLEDKHYVLQGNMFQVHCTKTPKEVEDLTLPDFGLRSGNEISPVMVACNGYIFLLNGAYFARFLPNAKKWEVLSPPGAPRLQPSLTELNGFLYVIGGFQTSGDNKEVLQEKIFVVECERFNLSELRWEDISPMKCSRAGHYVCVVDGQLVVAGESQSNEAVGEVEEYDSLQNQWTSRKIPLPYVTPFPSDSKFQCFASETICLPP